MADSRSTGITKAMVAIPTMPPSPIVSPVISVPVHTNISARGSISIMLIVPAPSPEQTITASDSTISISTTFQVFVSILSM